ncbi:MAG: histidinol dehydrogenase [Coriobacteriales bacterium]|jgi:histidinol dehydrogenase|nr:histidinol dehydrogenase [Coriobacteriales bacterium]
MMQVLSLESGQTPPAELISRRAVFDPDVQATVHRIIEAVRQRGDEALAEFTQEFDGVLLGDLRLGLRVDEQELQAAAKRVDKDLQRALHETGQNIFDFHESQRRSGTLITRDDGAVLGSKLSPLDSVGIYVPGGQAVYPSTVLMCALPARVAGVRRVAMFTPPGKDGKVDPAILLAAQIAGVSEVYRVGGAQAIAALAYGTQSIRPVDKIVGPGNAYVACAKRMVSGDVGIDLLAGPSELAILADDSAEPSLLAIDLMAQAEHDTHAACYLITTDPELAEEVPAEIDAFLEDSPRADITRHALDQNGIIFVAPDLETALLAVNTIAPEHLEVQMNDAWDLLGLIDNAGALFVGPWSPVAVGDYAAGPNHTLPTSGTARFASPLSVDDFVKSTSVISYSYSALKADGDNIVTIANSEGLWAHGKSIRARFELLDDEGLA